MRIFISILLFILLASPPTIAQSDNYNLIWMQKNHTQISNLLESKAPLSTTPTINTLYDIWVNRDGAVSGEVSPLILAALNNHTEHTLHYLSINNLSFEKWLSELEGIVFTDFSGDTISELKALKHKTIKTLETYLAQDDALYTENGNTLLITLRAIKVRSVN